MFTLGDGCHGEEFQAKRRQFVTDAVLSLSDADDQNGGIFNIVKIVKVLKATGNKPVPVTPACAPLVGRVPCRVRLP
jgi:hypothetical protein